MIQTSVWLPWPQFNTASLPCPKCGKSIMLSDYKIDATGIITPDPKCNNCGYQLEPTRLVGWPAEIIL